MAFITGRSESGRDFTVKNLAQQDFGNKCERDRSGKVQRPKGTPCYVELHMRNLKGVPSLPMVTPSLRTGRP